MLSMGDFGQPLGPLLGAVAEQKAAAVDKYLECARKAWDCYKKGDTQTAENLKAEAASIRAPIVAAIAERLIAAEGRFRYLGVLNDAGSGFVIHLRDRARGEDIALKLHIHSLQDDRTKQRLADTSRQNIELVRDLSLRPIEPGIVGPFFYFERSLIPGCPIMEWSPAEGDLFQRVAAVRRIARELEQLRSRGAPCHLKSSYALVSEREGASLTDYGFFLHCLTASGLPAEEGVLPPQEIPQALAPFSEEQNVFVLAEILLQLVRIPFPPSALPAATAKPESFLQKLIDVCEPVAAGRSKPPKLEDFIGLLDDYLVVALALSSRTFFASGDYGRSKEWEERLESFLDEGTAARIAEKIEKASGGRYRNLRSLDRGGMGVIFAGRDTELNVVRIFKVPLLRRFSEETRQEVMRLAKVRHKNIVTVHEFNTADDLCYIVMDYLPGTDLQRLFSSSRTDRKTPLFSPREAAAVVRDVASAVAYLHNQDPPVVHNDIKPRNIQIVDLDQPVSVGLETESRIAEGKAASKPRRWEAVLLDFGLCRSVGETPPQYGTRGWIAPERHPDAPAGRIGPESDVWNLGALLYYLLTDGELVHEIESEPGLERCSCGIEADRHPSPRTILRRRGAPRRLAGLAQRCLDRDPGRRPSAASVVESLDYFLEEARLWRDAALALIFLIGLSVLGFLLYKHCGPPAIDQVELLARKDGKVAMLVVGSGFEKGARVTFAGTNAESVTVRSNTELLAQFPLDRLPADKRCGLIQLELTVPWRWGKAQARVPLPIDPETIGFSQDVYRVTLPGTLWRQTWRARLCFSQNLFGKGHCGLVVPLQKPALALLRFKSGTGLRCAEIVDLRDRIFGLAVADTAGDGQDEILLLTPTDLLLLERRGPQNAFSLSRRWSGILNWDERSPVSLLTGDFDGRKGTDAVIFDGNRLCFFSSATLQSGDNPTSSPVKENINALAKARLFPESGPDGLVALISRPEETLLIPITIEKNEFVYHQEGAERVNAERATMVVGDFDGDGADSVGVVKGDEVYLYLFTQKGGVKRFERIPRSVRPVPAPVTDIQAAPLKQKNKADIFALTAQPGFRRFIAWLQNVSSDGSVKLATPAFIPCPTEHEPVALGLGDLTADGITDLVVATDEEILLRPGTGGGEFEKLTLAGSRSPHAFPAPNFLVKADFNGDGLEDLATPNAADDSVAVLLRKPGDLSFEPPYYLPVGKEPRFAGAGDLDSDGDPDLVVTNYRSGTLTIYWNPGNVRFSTGDREDIRLPQRSAQPRGLLIDDADGDGCLDIVVAVKNREVVTAERNGQKEKRGKPGWVTIFYGTGKPKLGEPQIIEVGTAPRFCALSDLNRDGTKDLAVACEEYTPDRPEGKEKEETVSGELWILFNQGGRVYQVGQRLPAEHGLDSEPEYVVAGDINRDGRPDLAVSYRHETVVLLQQKDGTFGSPDPSAGLLAERGQGDPETILLSDLDSDGYPDLIVCDEFRDRIFVLKTTAGRNTEGRISFQKKSELSLSIGSPQAAVLLQKGLLAAAGRSENVIRIFDLGAPFFRKSRVLCESRLVNRRGSRSPQSLCIGRLEKKSGAYACAFVQPVSRKLLIYKQESGKWSLAWESPEARYGVAPESVVPLDFNGDGELDFAVVWVDRARESRISIFSAVKKTLTAFEEKPIVLPSSFGPHTVLTAAVWKSSPSGAPHAEPLDCDGDGAQDMAVATNGKLALLCRKAGSERVHVRTVRGGIDPLGLILLEIRPDHSLTWAVLARRCIRIFHALRFEEGSSTAQVAEPAREQDLFFPQDARTFGAADFNRDGVADLVVLHPKGLSVFLANRDGTFEPAPLPSRSTISTAPFPKDLADMAIADFDLDGLPDVVAVDQSTNCAFLFLNDTRGNLTLLNKAFPLGLNPEAVVACDFAPPEQVQDLLVLTRGSGLQVLEGRYSSFMQKVK